MARKLDLEEERRFLEALENPAVSVGDDPSVSAACLQRKQEVPLTMSPELVAWLMEHKPNPFSF
jgi:hypothetical protein